MAKEGSGTYDGVDYTYKLTAESWFGVYTCRVHKSFLDVPGKMFGTEEFQIGGHDWQIGLSCREDGCLGAAVISRDVAEVQAHYSVTVVNQGDASKCRSRGRCKRFSFNEPDGSIDFVTVAEIKDKDAGFLDGDFFVIKVQIRLKLPENEESSLSAEGNVGTFTWKLKDVHGMSSWILYSEHFVIGGCEWQLAICPIGWDHDFERLPFMLLSKNDSTIKLRYKLSVINHQSPDKNLTLKSEETFNNTDATGNTKLLEVCPWADETLGFLKDGWITLTALIVVLDNKPERAVTENELISLIHRFQDSVASQANRARARPSQEVGISDSNSTSDEEAVTDPADSSADEEHANPNTEKSAVSEDVKGLKFQPVLQDDSFDFLDKLEPGTVLANRYVIGDERVPGKLHIRFAVHQLSGQAVVLKFYSSRESFDKSLELNKLLPAQYVCKAIDFIDEGKLGCPPCLVLEKGIYTLKKWIKEVHSDFFKRKGVLHEVLQCLKSIHSQNIVHGDIKPSNIMFFPSSHSWKLLDADLGAKTGEHCAVQYTPMYAAPEVVQAEENGHTEIVTNPSMDMFSFGIVAFEVLTGNRFYGPSADADTVRSHLCNGGELPSLESVEERQARRWLRGLLCRDTEKRWSAQRALSHAMFKTAEDSTQIAAGFRQIGHGCLVQERTVAAGRIHELRIKNAGSLNVDEEIEGNTFEAGGKNWKLVLLLREHNSGLYDVYKILLVSCNARGVEAHVNLAVKLNGNRLTETRSRGEWSMAAPFDIMARHDITQNQLTDSHELRPDDELVVTAHLKDVRNASEVDALDKKVSRNVSLEVIGSIDIRTWVNQGNAFGLAPANRIRHSDICSCSLIRPWAGMSPDHRYWLCKRDSEGRLSVKRCLNEAAPLERFEDICIEDCRGIPWVTVVEEDKPIDKYFEPVDVNTFIIFVKLLQPSYKDLSYLGHLIIRKTMPCQDLLAKIAHELARFPDGKKYNAYVEREGHRIEDITPILSPLPEYGTDAGFVIILREQNPNERNVSVQDVERDLRAVHNKSSIVLRC